MKHIAMCIRFMGIAAAKWSNAKPSGWTARFHRWSWCHRRGARDPGKCISNWDSAQLQELPDTPHSPVVRR